MFSEGLGLVLQFEVLGRLLRGGGEGGKWVDVPRFSIWFFKDSISE